MKSILLGVAVLLLAISLSACNPDEPAPAGDLSSSLAMVNRTGFPGPSYERSFVFMTTATDSLLLVPWLLETTLDSNTVFREAHGWVDRDGTWEPFLAERWQTPPTRYPARILPYGTFRIVVGENDRVDGIIYTDGLRNLELALGRSVAQWGGPREERLRLLEASLHLGEQGLNGIVLDMTRLNSSDTPVRGDWAFLTSGDSLQIVVQGDLEHDIETPPNYRGWGLLDSKELQWPSLRIDWVQVSAYQPARRDLPISWALSSPIASVVGTLEVLASEIVTGTESGPVLSVQALFEVVGTISIDGLSFPVRGLFNHRRR